MKTLKTLKDKANLTAMHMMNYMKEKKGEGSFTDVVIVILIVAIVGSVILGLLRIAMPDVFNTIITKVKAGVGGIDMSQGLNG